MGLGEEKDPVEAGNYLKASADLGNANAQLILDSYMGVKQGSMEGVEPPGGPNSMALVYYKAAAANGRLGQGQRLVLSAQHLARRIAQGVDHAVTERDLQCTLSISLLILQHTCFLLMPEEPLC